MNSLIVFCFSLNKNTFYVSCCYAAFVLLRSGSESKQDRELHIGSRISLNDIYKSREIKFYLWTRERNLKIPTGCIYNFYKSCYIIATILYFKINHLNNSLNYVSILCTSWKMEPYKIFTCQFVPAFLLNSSLTLIKSETKLSKKYNKDDDYNDILHLTRLDNMWIKLYFNFFSYPTGIYVFIFITTTMY
jgi:hypothetical protein